MEDTIDLRLGCDCLPWVDESELKMFLDLL